MNWLAMSRISIGVLSFSRSDYLRRCLESLAANTEISKATVYVFQDGAVNQYSGQRYAPDSAIEECVKVFNAAVLPHKELVRQRYNIGPAAGVSTMFIEMFSHGHDYVTMMADDMFVNPFYVKTHRVVMEQFADDPSVGVLRTGPTEAPFRGGPIYTKEEALQFQNLLCRGFYMMQDFGTWRRGWERIRGDIEFFHEQVTGCDWRQVVDYSWTGGTRGSDPRFRAIQERFGTFPEDVIHIRAAERAGLGGIHTVIPRISGFGPKSSLRSGYEGEWSTFRMEEITLWSVGDADHYEIVQCSRVGEMIGIPRATQQPVRMPDWVTMVYVGRQGSPFSIRGAASRKVYYRVERGKPFRVLGIDANFFKQVGFVVTYNA